MNLHLGLNINLGFKNFKSSAEVTIFSLEYFSRSTIYHDGVFVGGTSSLSTHIVPTTDSPGTFDFDFTLIFLECEFLNVLTFSGQKNFVFKFKFHFRKADHWTIFR